MKYAKIKNRELHRIVTTAIIYKSGKFLITKRSLDKKVFPGKWTVPGGGLEIDDYVNTPPTIGDAWYFSLSNTLKREIKEEVGLGVGKINYLLDITFIRPDNIPVLVLSFYAPWKKGRVKLNSESMDFAWITAKETINYDFIEGIGSEIRRVDALLKGRDPNRIRITK